MGTEGRGEGEKKDKAFQAAKGRASAKALRARRSNSRVRRIRGQSRERRGAVSGHRGFLSHLLNYVNIFREAYIILILFFKS